MVFIDWLYFHIQLSITKIVFVDVPAAKRRLPEYYGFPLAVRARLGGVLAQIVYAGVHALAHFSAAICLLLLLELGIEMVMRAHVGDQGYHSLFKWYQEFESEHFPDPAGLRATISSWYELLFFGNRFVSLNKSIVHTHLCMVMCTKVTELCQLLKPSYAGVWDYIHLF